MSNDCKCEQAQAPTREEALALAADLIEQGESHVNEGRATEAQVMNALAQTALALADRCVNPSLSGRVH